MPLPKCVKVNHCAYRVGTLLTYEGDVPHEGWSEVRHGRGSHAWPIAKEIRWSGRLWRDLTINLDDAWWETEQYIKSRWAYFIPETAFVVLEHPVPRFSMNGERIGLIGIHPDKIGQGIARKLIKHVSKGHIIAGTYDDNDGACALYERMGMKVVKREEVYHEN